MLVGGDGAHSWVRRTLDIPMEGDSTGAALYLSCLNCV